MATNHTETTDPALDPYRPPRDQTSGEASQSDEDVRRRYLSHEASVRAVGAFLVVFGALYVLVAITGPLWMLPVIEPSPFEIGVLLFFSAFGGLIGWWFYKTGRGLRDLDEAARRPTMGLAFLSFLALPVGPFVGYFIVRLLTSEEGERVLSADYRQIRDRTPHIRHGTPRWVWIVVGLFVLLVIVARLLPTLFVPTGY